MLDALRAHYPELGFSLFAMEPGQPVTLEIYTPDEQVYSFTGNTVRAAIEKAFPLSSFTTPEPKQNIPAVTASVFD